MINQCFAYEYVYEQILRDIENGELKENGYLLSEKEYCRKFDVSLTTVRRALERLRAECIVEKIKGKGTFLSSKVRCVCCPPNRYIGMLVLSPSEQNKPGSRKTKYVNMYAHNIYKSIFRELNGEYNLLIDTIADDEVEKRFPSSVLSHMDKLLLMGETRRSVVEYLHGQRKCVVVYNYFEPDVQVCRVNNDERRKFGEVVGQFVKRGHSRIACINGTNNFSESLERYMGYQDAMILNDLYIDARYVKWGNMTPEDGYDLTKELLAVDPRPTCIVCINDGVAMGACDAIADAGLMPGRDVLVSGHDNALGDNYKYKFTTIDPLYDNVGKIIADKLRRTTWIDDETIQPGTLIFRGEDEEKII